MRYWWREVAGWFVVAIGLYVFYLCYRLLLAHYVAETGYLTVIGIFLFRGGIHLLKMAVAAQVCMEAQNRPAPAGSPAPSGRQPVRAVGRADSTDFRRDRRL
jgi:hypothetical protein